jgi:carboxypeptidase C (cathepsin A)
VYDVREKCQVPPLCYDFSNLDAFLALPEVIDALGVAGRSWVSCNRLVTLQLVFAGDWMRNLALQVPAILASGVRIVVYSGEYDFVSAHAAKQQDACACLCAHRFFAHALAQERRSNFSCKLESCALSHSTLPCSPLAMLCAALFSLFPFLRSATGTAPWPGRTP